jgi:hypothetical protein
MSDRLLATCLLILNLSLLGGCGSNYERRIYTVQLTNQTNTTISVGLIKKGKPLQEGWVAPEDIAILAPPLIGRHWGQTVKPDQTILLGPQEGAFAEGNIARIRVYAGTPTVEETVGYSRADPDRLDIDLWPGRSSYIIRRENRRLIEVQNNE